MKHLREPKNIFIYLMDDLRPDHLSCFGYPRKTSPCIDRFAADSIVFENAYTHSSWTKPVVATLLTGCYPSTHGAAGRCDSLGPRPTIAHLLKSNGFNTAGFVTSPMVFTFYGFGGGFDNYVQLDPPELYARSDALNEAFFAWLGTKPRRPMFCYLHSLDPHHPRIQPPPFDKKYSATPPGAKGKPRGILNEINLYDGAIAFNDSQFGKFIDRLKKEKLYDDSLIILLSDHGEEFREHGGIWHGFTLYQEMLRVPLIMKLPGSRGAGSREPRTARMVDIFPTLLEWLNIAPSAKCDGESLLPIVNGKKTSGWRPPLFAEENLDGNELRSWIDGDYKIVDRLRPERRLSLFNIVKDPREKNDIASAAPDIAAKLKLDLDKFVSGLLWGFYIEITNGAPLQTKHHVKGTLKIGGAPKSADALLEAFPPDCIKRRGKNNLIEFDFKLENKVHPRNGLPPVIVGAARVRMKIPGSGAKIELSLEQDGKPLPVKRYFLGGSPTPCEQKSSNLCIDASDSGLLAMPGDPPPLPPAGNDVSCRVYIIPGGPAGQVEIDPKLLRRMQALGYFA